MSRWEWLLVCGILIVGAGLRFAYLQEVRQLPDFERPAIDAEFHDYWARGLAFDAWEPRAGRPDPGIRTSPYFRPPGYPYFLGAVYSIFGDGYVAPRVTHMFLGLLGVTLTFLYARPRFGRTTALLAALGMSTYWSFLFFEGELQATALFVCLLLVFLNVLSAWLARGSWFAALAAGAIGGVAALVRPNFLAILGAAALWMIWVVPANERKRGAKAVAGLALGAVLAIAPVTARNAVVSGDFVPISANSGINLFIGNNPDADGLVMSEIPSLGDFGTSFDWPGIVRSLERSLDTELSDAQADRHFAREGFGFIASHPLRSMALTWKKGLLFWGPLEVGHNKEVTYERLHSGVLSRVPGNFPFVLALGVVGLAWLAVERKSDADALLRWNDAVLLLLAGTAYFLSVLPFFAAARYRVPIVPILLVFGGWGATRFLTAVRRRRWLEIALCAGGFGLLYAGATQPLADYRPSSARWHYDRGVAFDRAGETNRAREHYEASLRDDVTFFYPRYNLARLHMREGRLNDAVTHWEASLKARENYAPTHYNLARIYRQSRDLERAVAHLQRAFELSPGTNRYHSELVETLRDLAAIYALHSDPAQRNPSRAVALAERANVLSGGGSPSVLDALGMAYAAAGRFEEASSAAAKALELAQASGMDGLARSIETRLASYREAAD